MAGPNRKPTRATPGRPRRVAGQARPGRVVDEAVVEEPVEVEDAVEDVVDEPVVLAKTEGEPEPEPAPPAPPPVATEPERPRSVVRTVALGVAAVLLAALFAGELVYLTSDDDARISAAEPVLAPELTVRRVVEMAAEKFDVITTVNPATYDADVETAAALMTDAFAEKFRATKADVKEAVLADNVTTAIDIDGFGVKTATDQEVVALLYFTQTTTKTGGDPLVVQYRTEVTMTDTADGWLVSDLHAL